MADPMRDESVRAWLADHREIATLDGNVTTGTVTPSEIACPDCGQGLAVRFRFERLLGEMIIADAEWTEGTPHHWTRPWSRTDARRPARHAGYQKRTRHEPITLPSDGTLPDHARSSAHPGIRELDPYVGRQRPRLVASGKRGAERRWGPPRLLHIGDLTAEQRQLVLARVEALRNANAPAASDDPAGASMSEVRDAGATAD